MMTDGQNSKSFKLLQVPKKGPKTECKICEVAINQLVFRLWMFCFSCLNYSTNFAHCWLRAYSLGVYYFFVVDSVSPSVTNKLQIASFLFLNGVEPFFGRQLSMWHSTKLFSSIFDLGSLTPKIYSPKLGVKKFKLLLFCFSTESNRFLVVSSPWPPLQNVLRFLI